MAAAKKTTARKPVVKKTVPARVANGDHALASADRQNVASLLREIDAGLSDIQKRIYSLRERP